MRVLIVLMLISLTVCHEYAMFYPNWKGALEKLDANKTSDLSSFNASQIINLWIKELASKVQKQIDAKVGSENDIKPYKTGDDHIDLDAMKAIEVQIVKAGEKIEKAIKAFEEGNSMFKKSKNLVQEKVITPVKNWWKKYF